MCNCLSLFFDLNYQIGPLRQELLYKYKHGNEEDHKMLKEIKSEVKTIKTQVEELKR